MARANVSSKIVDESAVIPSQEGESSFVAGYIDTDLYPTNLLGSLGFTHEREQGFMVVESIGEWHERLKTNQPTGYDPGPNNSAETNENEPFLHAVDVETISGNVFAGLTFSRWPNGPGKQSWSYDWTFIENYLKYGGKIKIFSQKEGEVGSGERLSRAKNKKISIDAFVSQFFSLNNDIRTIVEDRKDCIAITSVPSENLSGENYGRRGPDAVLGDPTSFYQFWSGTTWGYTASGYAYDVIPDGSSAQKFPLDVPFLKNTGDIKYPPGRNVFSVYYYNNIPSQSMYGPPTGPGAGNTTQFKKDQFRIDSGTNYQSYGIIGCTFSSSYIESGDGNGVTFSFVNDFLSTPLYKNNGNVFYTEEDYISDGNGTKYETLVADALHGQIVSGEFRAPPFLGGITTEKLSRMEGLTFIKNSKIKGSPEGRILVANNLLGINLGKDFINFKETIGDNNSGGSASWWFNPADPDPVTNNYYSLAGFLNFAELMVPATWTYKNSIHYVKGLLNIKDTGGFVITPEGVHSYTIGGRNHSTERRMIDLRETLDSSYPHSQIDKIYGPGGVSENATIYAGLSADPSTQTHITEMAWPNRKRIDIFGTEGASLDPGIFSYWGCTCGTGITTFVGLVSGSTPDVCIEFGDNSYTRAVTAEGSTYRAYIGWSKPNPDINIAGHLNIFGEYIGDYQGIGGVSMADTITTLQGLKETETFITPFGQEVSPPSEYASVLFFPLIADGGSETYSLTADKENYFYAGSNQEHLAGPVNATMQLNDKNLNLFNYGEVPQDTMLINQPAFSGRGVENLPAARTLHWYSQANAVGGTLSETIGTQGNPSTTFRNQFYGTGGVNNDGYTSDGIHLLAEIGFARGGKPKPGWPGVGGFAPEEQYDSRDFTYSNIFSSSADLYEFPVFGEKYSKNSFQNYSSEETANMISSAKEIAFTSDTAGIFSRLFRDLSPWFSPGNQKVSSISDIISERYPLTNTEQDSLYDSKVNFIKNIDGNPRLFGDKTFGDPTSTFSRVNVTNLFIYLKKKLEPLGRSLLFEQNDARSRKLFVNGTEPFLKTLVGQRAITDFRVVCDETNNGPDIVDSNQFVADIFIKPTKTINFIKITLTNSGTSFELE